MPFPSRCAVRTRACRCFVPAERSWHRFASANAMRRSGLCLRSPGRARHHLPAVEYSPPEAPPHRDDWWAVGRAGHRERHVRPRERPRSGGSARHGPHVHPYGSPFTIAGRARSASSEGRCPDTAAVLIPVGGGGARRRHRDIGCARTARGEDHRRRARGLASCTRSAGQPMSLAKVRSLRGWYGGGSRGLTPPPYRVAVR